jgi:hypothetical protein
MFLALKRYRPCQQPAVQNRDSRSLWRVSRLCHPRFISVYPVILMCFGILPATALTKNVPSCSTRENLIAAVVMLQNRLANVQNGLHPEQFPGMGGSDLDSSVHEINNALESSKLYVSRKVQLRYLVVSLSLVAAAREKFDKNAPAAAQLSALQDDVLAVTQCVINEVP